jgi:hypothetical protein
MGPSSPASTTPSAFIRIVPDSSLPDSLWTTDGMTASSVSTRNRGASTRRSTSLRAVTKALPSPTRDGPDTPRAVARQRVRLSGSVTLTVALPSGPVTTPGSQAAVSANVLRSVGSGIGTSKSAKP